MQTRKTAANTGSNAIVVPVVISRSEHNISRALISEYALKVLYRLKGEGFAAYLVGGGVRDLLLGREPKDFDIATNARPEEVRAVFRNCRLIGRRFRLAHVHFGRDIVEVATFRGGQEEVVADNHQTEAGMLLRDNVYGTLEQDAIRRDFSVNALYYNIKDFSIIDHVGGLEDLNAGILRMLGDPEQRYREDPVRMLRAARFAAKLGFRLDPATEGPIKSLAPLLADVPPARLFDEVLKLFMGGTAVAAFERLRRDGQFAQLFPDTEDCLATEEHEFPVTLVLRGLENTDSRVGEGKPVTPAFMFAVLLWEPVRCRAAQLERDGLAPYPALQQAAAETVSKQVQRVAIPRRYSAPMNEIWALQTRFGFRRGKRPQRTLSHPRFRAAYDFLLLRAAAGEVDNELAQWWTDYQNNCNASAVKTAKSDDTTSTPKRRRRRRRKPRKVPATDG